MLVVVHDKSNDQGITLYLALFDKLFEWWWYGQ